jgi:hypothetical protein
VKEGCQTDAGEQDGQRRTNVVRLPRDWLGPREELVPFGPRAGSRAPDEPPSTDDPAAPTADQLTVIELTAADAAPTAGELTVAELTAADAAPPSAEDFWGERSMAVHGALQAPAGWAPADSAPADQNATLRGRIGVRAIRPRRFDRRAVALATAGLAACAVAVIAVVSIFAASAAPQPAGGSKAGVAAVLSGGVSRIFQLGLARIETSVGHEGAAVAARSTAPRARRTPHHVRAPKPMHKAPRSPSHPALTEVARTTTAPSSAYRPAAIGTDDATSEVRTTTPTDIPPARSAPPRSVSQPLPSRATVSSTGQSGALGPIHSPNG